MIQNLKTIWRSEKFLNTLINYIFLKIYFKSFYLNLFYNINVIMNLQKAFTNSLYDECNTKKKYQESTGPFNWITQSVYESPDSCFQDQSPYMHNNFNSIPSSKIDTESELRNQSRHLSRCPSKKYDPSKAQESPIDAFIKTDCKKIKMSLEPEYTREKKPCNLSGININRFNPLCDNLQDITTIHSNSYIGRNTRLLVKDAFTKKNTKPKGFKSKLV